MDVNRIISELDTEIARLQQIRSALSGVGASALSLPKPGRGRPKGSKNAPKNAGVKTAAKPVASKRKLSPEGRKRIAEAMKRRWADRRKQTAAKKEVAK